MSQAGTPPARGGRRRRGGAGRPAAEGEIDWVARIADELIATAQERRPGETIVCASGLSPSGPIHLGNLREVMTPHLVADEVRRRGLAVEHLISWDDYDRFRKVPVGIDGVDESWNAYIGMPLTSVPPPRGSRHPSWAEHFRAEMTQSLAELGVEFRGISQTQMYTSGAYRDQVLHAMAHRDEIDAVLAPYRTKAEAPKPESSQSSQVSQGVDLANVDDEQAARAAEEGSGAADEDEGTVYASGDYYPFRPYCERCGKDSTRVIAYGQAGRKVTELDYSCYSCGGLFVMDLDRDFHGKLVWKVDWPMRWAYEGVDFEPSGVDHQSPGSSYVVGGQIVGPIFGGWQPMGPMYAFVGISGMAKMSSSKGGVPTPADALAIMEPALLRWLYVRRRPNQAFSVAFDQEIQRLYDEWDRLLGKVDTDKAQPGDRAMVMRSTSTAQTSLPATPVRVPYRALASIADITGGNPQQMLRILSGFGVDSLEDVQPRLDRAQTWVQTQLPEDERTRVRTAPDTELLASLDEEQRAELDLFAERLTDDWSLDGLTTLVYGVPKLRAGLPIGEKKLPPEVKAAQRSLFALLYRLLVGTDTGPRIPTLLLCVGHERVRTLIGR